MKYISLGAVLEPSTEHIVKVSHCGIDYTLTQELASLWLDGRFGFAKAENPIEMKALDQLFRMGLVMTTSESEEGEYRALTVTDERIGEAIQFIMPNQRAVLLLSFFKEYSDMDIARLMKISHKTVEYRKAMAMKKLKALLEEK